MKRLIIGLMASLILVFALAGTALADHDSGPCNDHGEPGNSDYGILHIKALATVGGLGDGGHKPGVHMGFSTCLGVH